MHMRSDALTRTTRLEAQPSVSWYSTLHCLPRFCYTVSLVPLFALHMLEWNRLLGSVNKPLAGSKWSSIVVNQWSISLGSTQNSQLLVDHCAHSNLAPSWQTSSRDEAKEASSSASNTEVELISNVYINRPCYICFTITEYFSLALHFCFLYFHIFLHFSYFSVCWSSKSPVIIYCFFSKPETITINITNVYIQSSIILYLMAECILADDKLRCVGAIQAINTVGSSHSHLLDESERLVVRRWITSIWNIKFWLFFNPWYITVSIRLSHSAYCLTIQSHSGNIEYLVTSTNIF